MADTDIHTVREEIYCSWGGKRNSWGERTQGPGLLCECARFTVHRFISSQSPLKVDLGMLLNWKNIHLTRTQTFIWVKTGSSPSMKRCRFLPTAGLTFSFKDVDVFYKDWTQDNTLLFQCHLIHLVYSLVYTGSSSLRQNTPQVNLPAVKHKDRHLMTKA